MNEYRPGGFQQLPLVVKNLIIINALVFLLQNVLEKQGINVDNLFALHYWASPYFRWWQLITHMFMHGSLGHIFMNMFALWMFGRILENVWGPQRFLLFCFVCGVGAAFCHLGVLAFEFNRFHTAYMHFQENPTFVEYAQLVRHTSLKDDPIFTKILAFWNENQQCSDCGLTAVRLINQRYMAMINEATIGASGAVFGVLFAFGYLFPNTLLYVYFAIPVKAKWFVAAYAAIELFSGIQSSAGDNVAHFAHLGGMLFAFILLRIWNDRYRNRFY
jgi:membrane associated rhomboid family serine protease